MYYIHIFGNVYKKHALFFNVRFFDQFEVDFFLAKISREIIIYCNFSVFSAYVFVTVCVSFKLKFY